MVNQMDDREYMFGISTKNVKGVNISRHSDGYNYASISCQMAEKEYMHLSYEWGTDTIPEFAMNVMDIIKNVPTDKANIDADALERAGKYMVEMAKAVKNKSK